MTITTSWQVKIGSMVSNRVNLCSNPGFETNSGGWGNISNTVVARVAATWASGASVLQVTCNNATGIGTFVGNTGVTSYDVTGNLTYTASIYARHISGTARQANVTFLWTRPTGNTFASSGTLVTLSATPQRLSVTATAPANATGLTIWIECKSSGTTTAADISQWDMCLLEQSSSVEEYFDGSSSWRNTWNGTTFLSSSTQNVLSRLNRAYNGTLTTNTSSWQAFGGLTSLTRVAATWGFGNYIDGNNVIRAVCSGTASAIIQQWQYNTSGTYYQTYGSFLNFTASVYGKYISGSNRTWSIAFHWYDAASTFISSTLNTFVPLGTGAPTRLSISATAPSTAALFKIVISSGTGTAGDVTEFDGLMIEEGSTLGSYFGEYSAGCSSYTAGVGVFNNTPAIDVTSRTLGASISQTAPVMAVGTGSATIQLNNNDGAFTPLGGGTYTSTDWFSQAMVIQAIVTCGSASYVCDVFHGLITDFSLEDIGLQSTVTLTAQDAFSAMARNQSVSYQPLAASADSFENAIQYLLQGSTSLWAATTPAVYYPKLGYTSSSTVTALFYGNNLITRQDSYASTSAQTNVSTIDLINTFVMTTNQAVFYPTYIYTNKFYGVAFHRLTRGTGNTNDFSFQPTGSVSGTAFPFKDLNQSFDITSVVTTATVSRASGAAVAQTANNSTALSLYGSRAITYSNVGVQTDATALVIAQEQVGRYSTSRFAPRNLTITANMVEGYCADTALDKWRHFLTLDTGLWQKASITWTGKGAASQTYNTKIKNRTISITPTDATFALDLVPYIDNSTWIVGTDAFSEAIIAP